MTSTFATAGLRAMSRTTASTNKVVVNVIFYPFESSHYDIFVLPHVLAFNFLTMWKLALLSLLLLIKILLLSKKSRLLKSVSGPSAMTWTTWLPDHLLDTAAGFTDNSLCIYAGDQLRQSHLHAF